MKGTLVVTAGGGAGGSGGGSGARRREPDPVRIGLGRALRDPFGLSRSRPRTRW